jgi:tetratricopeptide (TPR) repeat protein
MNFMSARELFYLAFFALIMQTGCMSDVDKGAASFRAGDYEMALVHYEQAQQFYPNDVSILYNLARTHEELDNYPEAISFYNLYLDKSSDKLPGFLGRGRCYFQEDYLEGAEIDFTNALRIEKNSLDAYYMRGRTRIMMRHISDGLSDLDRALQMDQEHVRAHYYRGIGYAAIGSYNAARKDFDFVIMEEPEIVEAFYNRAFCFEQSFDLVNAIEDYTRALELRSDYANALAKRGVLYLRTSKKESACQDFMMLQELNDRRGAILVRKYCGRA